MEGELVNTSLEFKFHLQFPCGSQPTELSDFRQSARSRNKRKCKQTEKNALHFALTFPMQIFQFQRGSCKLSFLFPPRCQLEHPIELVRGIIQQRNRQLFESAHQRKFWFTLWNRNRVDAKSGFFFSCDVTRSSPALTVNTVFKMITSFSGPLSYPSRDE